MLNAFVYLYIMFQATLASQLLIPVIVQYFPLQVTNKLVECYNLVLPL